MDKQHFQAIVSAVGAKEAGGWWEVPEGKSVTLYAASHGVPLTISRAVAIKVDDKLVHAKTAKGETFVVLDADVFAGSIDGGVSTSRKAGFL
jgi:hypothetical protein